MSRSIHYYRERKFEKPITFAVKHKDYETRMASRSGGIFTALSDKVLQKKGVIYGCVLDEDFTAVHFRAEKTEDRNRMRGSKYIQSEMREIYKAVKEDLDMGREVMFSGTSCQIAGLNGFLGRDYTNLLSVDIVCHGVPSPMVWKDYLKWQEKKNGSRIQEVDFRNKKSYGWKAHVETLYLENGNQVDSRVFTTLFYGHSFLRPSCYKCPYKDIIHPGNITIADYWGIDVAAPGFNDNKGVSLVLINDEKGMDAFNIVRDELIIRDTRIEDSIQPPLMGPYNEPVNREKVWAGYYKYGFKYIAQRYGKRGIVYKLRRKIMTLIKRRNDSIQNPVRKRIS